MPEQRALGAQMKVCSVLLEDLAEEVLSELGPEGGQEFARQRRGGRTFHARGEACAKAQGR